MKTLILLIGVAIGPGGARRPAPPTARELAPDTYLVPGAVPADRRPDGNPVIVVAPEGLIAIDTGRHPAASKRDGEQLGGIQCANEAKDGTLRFPQAYLLSIVRL